jgi:predicted site-specific integrase-resolvase
MNNERFVSTKETRKILGVTTKTLVNWSKTGKINTIKSPSGVRLYCFKDIQNILGCDIDIKEKKKIVYCRVSSIKQKDDLNRQTDFFRHEYPDHDVVEDIGSGINWKRKGLKTILEQSMQGCISEIVVAHRDRLCRFGFELIQWILEINDVKLVVLDRESNKSQDQELTDDILSIIHVYSCRQMGKRRYAVSKNKNLSDCEPKENV